jgi:release factor glutamine methyltransferase
MKKNSIHDLITNLDHQLQNAGCELSACQQNAWLLLEKLLGKSREKLIIQGEIILTDKQHKVLEHWLKDVINNQKPIQYILGSVQFDDLEIFVEQPILIPRPETEYWCELLAKRYHSLNYQPKTVFDLCTGSGCIALYIAASWPNAYVIGTDISDQALTLAQKNATHNKIKNVRFEKADVFPSLQKADLIVSNPPYISESEFQSLDPSVRDWEDYKALVAKDRGFYFIKKILDTASSFLTENKTSRQNVWIEIGSTQGEEAAKYAQNKGFSAIEIIEDQYKKPRILACSVDGE